MAEKLIGVVLHYWSKAGAAGIKITDGELRVGDTVHIKGHTTDLTEVVESMQVEHEAVETAHPGDEIGINVSDHVREHDQVFKVTPD